MGSGTTARIAATIAAAGVAASLLFAGTTQAGPGSTVPTPENFYGMGLNKSPSPADLGYMYAGGVESVRLILDWRTVQPTGPDTFDWTSIDAQFRKFATARLEVVPQLISTPGWLGPTTHTPPVHSREAKQDWMAFVAAAVARYGPNGSFWTENPDLAYTPVTFWQVWNEMNSPGFFDPKPDPKVYTKLLAISREATAGVDPSAQVVLGGMFKTHGKKHSIPSEKFIRELYDDGAAPYFDVVAIHPYGATVGKVTAQVRGMRDTIASEGDDAALWVDEIGWGSAKTGSNLNKGPHGQAKLLTQAYRFFTSHASELNLTRVYWYTLRDVKHPPNKCPFCTSDGLLDRKGNPKPAWDAFEQFAAPSH